MKKPDPIELLSAYLDGELTSEEASLAESLLAEQPEYRELLSELADLSLANLPMTPAPAPLFNSIMSAIQQSPRLPNSASTVSAGVSDRDASLATQSETASRDANDSVLSDGRNATHTQQTPNSQTLAEGSLEQGSQSQGAQSQGSIAQASEPKSLAASIRRQSQFHGPGEQDSPRSKRRVINSWLMPVVSLAAVLIVVSVTFQQNRDAGHQDIVMGEPGSDLHAVPEMGLMMARDQEVPSVAGGAPQSSPDSSADLKFSPGMEPRMDPGSPAMTSRSDMPTQTDLPHPLAVGGPIVRQSPEDESESETMRDMNAQNTLANQPTASSYLTLSNNAIDMQEQLPNAPVVELDDQQLAVKLAETQMVTLAEAHELLNPDSNAEIVTLPIVVEMKVDTPNEAVATLNHYFYNFTQSDLASGRDYNQNLIDADGNLFSTVEVVLLSDDIDPFLQSIPAHTAEVYAPNNGSIVRLNRVNNAIILDSIPNAQEFVHLQSNSIRSNSIQTNSVQSNSIGVNSNQAFAGAGQPGNFDDLAFQMSNTGRLISPDSRSAGNTGKLQGARPENGSAESLDSFRMLNESGMRFNNNVVSKSANGFQFSQLQSMNTGIGVNESYPANTGLIEGAQTYSSTGIMAPELAQTPHASDSVSRMQIPAQNWSPSDESGSEPGSESTPPTTPSLAQATRSPKSRGPSEMSSNSFGGSVTRQSPEASGGMMGDWNLEQRSNGVMNRSQNGFGQRLHAPPTIAEQRHRISNILNSSQEPQLQSQQAEQIDLRAPYRAFIILREFKPSAEQSEQPGPENPDVQPDNQGEKESAKESTDHLDTEPILPVLEQD